MKWSRLVGFVFFALVLLTAVASFAADPVTAGGLFRLEWSYPEILAEDLELYFQSNIPFSDKMKDVRLTLQVFGGSREVDGLFLAEDGLIENFQQGDAVYNGKNSTTIQNFVDHYDIPSYLMVVPTAAAIYQDRLPAQAPLYNQRQFLEELAADMSGRVNVVDVYLPLYYARDQYLYYRTAPELTTLGQYTVYQTLSKRMGFAPRPLDEFVLQRVAADYYGPLYEQWPYGGVRGDVVTCYENTALHRAYEVRHWDRYEQRCYYTLFPTEATLEGDVSRAILGGASPRIEIAALGMSAPTLLVIGDESSIGVLPFLALHYQEIHYINPALLTDSELAALDLEGYDHMLLVYSLDTYLNSDDPARIEAIYS